MWHGIASHRMAWLFFLLPSKTGGGGSALWDAGLRRGGRYAEEIEVVVVVVVVRLTMGGRAAEDG